MNIALRIPGRKRTKGLPDPRRYLRKGKCNHCGWCCVQEGCKDLVYVDGKYLCGLFYSDKRPLKCKLYPDDPPVKNPECGYYWLDRWENDKIVKIPKDMM